MSQKYIHCSWDILEPGSLIPRIPKSRVIGPNISEDDSTPISKGQQGNLLSSLRVHVHRYSCKQIRNLSLQILPWRFLSLQPECIR